MRAIWQEQDDDGCPELPVQPHITVESSPGKHHNYVLVKNVPLDDFQGLQACMVESYGSDPNAKDLSRVLRLPGFYHQKDPSSPHMVRIVCQSDEPPLNYEKAKVFFPPVVRLATIPTAQGDLPDDIDLEKIKSALYALDPDMEYGSWLNIGMALHDATSGAVEGLRLWDSWSNDGKKYVEGECESKWQSFNGGGITIATLFKMAIKEGWQWDYQTSCTDEQKEWEPPVPLDRPDLPQFDPKDFPSCLWCMIKAVSEFTETPIELPGLMALSVAATAIQKKMDIELEPGFQEHLSIWTCSILPPASRKSAVLGLFEKPLHEWERQQAEILEPSIQKAKFKRDTEQQRLTALQKLYARENDSVKREALYQDIEQLQIELSKPVPTVPRLTAQDITPEYLAVLLEENGEKIGIFSAEGGIFGNMGGRYNKGVSNLDVFLQSYSGENVRVDRSSRPPVLLKQPALSMGLAIQPEVVKSLANRQEFRGQGLLARFQFAWPKNNIGSRTLVSVPIPKDIEKAFNKTILEALNLPVAEEMPAIKLSPEAYTIWKRFQREVEDSMASGGEFEHMQDYGGKLAGLAGRIAGIFHSVEHVYELNFPKLDKDGDFLDPTHLGLSKHPCVHSLSSETMQRAVSLATKLGQHALYVYDQMGVDESIHVARKILQWIKRQDLEIFTARDCHKALKGRFQKRADLDPGFNILIDYGYIVPMEQIKKRGRPSEIFKVNPFIHR